MRCPFCDQDSDKVVDTRPVDDGLAIRRRRECGNPNCGRRFTTYERIEQSPLKVVKKDGSRQPYERHKLRAGVEKACSGLPVAADAIDRVVSSVEHALFTGYDREVASRAIGQLVMEELKRLNEVAYVRFASVYRKFQEAGDFYGVLKELASAQEGAQNANKVGKKA